MKNLFTREVKRTFYNLGKIPKSDGKKFRWLHKPVPNAETLQDFFYATHKSALIIANTLKDPLTTKRRLSKINNMAVPSIRAVRNINVPLLRIRSYKALAHTELMARHTDSAARMGLSPKSKLDDAILTLPASVNDVAKASAFFAKLTFCEVGNVFNLLPENVIGGVPGRHISEIITAAYDKAAVYKTDITGFFRNANKRIVKNSLLHACRKIYLPMLAETLFAREAAIEFKPIISAIKSDGITLSEDFWSEAVKVSGCYTTEYSFSSAAMPVDQAGMVHGQDLCIVIRERLAKYRRDGGSGDGLAYLPEYAAPRAYRADEISIPGQLFIAGQCRRLTDILHFTGYDTVITAKKILAELLLAVARDSTGIISPDTVMHKLLSEINLPDEMAELVHNILASIITHLTNSIIIPIIGSLFLFKVPDRTERKRQGVNISHSLAHRKVFSMLSSENDGVRTGMSCIKSSADLHSLVNDMASPLAGGLSLLLNRELNTSYADVAAVMFDDQEIWEKVISQPSSKESAEFENLFTVDFMVNAGEALRSIAGLDSSVSPHHRFHIMRRTDSYKGNTVSIQMLLNSAGDYTGAAVNRYGLIEDSRAITALKAGRTDDKAVLKIDADDSIFPVNGFVVTNGKNAPLHLLKDENLDTIEYDYRGRVRSTKLNTANAVVISDNPIKQASLREYVAHLEYEQITSAASAPIACGLPNIACDAVTPISLLTSDVCAASIIRMPTKKIVRTKDDIGLNTYSEKAISYEEAALLYTPKVVCTKNVFVCIVGGINHGEKALLMPSGCGDMLLAAKALLNSSATDKLDKLELLSSNMQYVISHAGLLRDSVRKAKISANNLIRELNRANNNTDRTAAFSLLTCESEPPATGPLKSLLATTDANTPRLLAVPYGNSVLLFRLTDEIIKSNRIDLLALYLAGEYTCIRDNRVTKHSARVNELVNLACDYALDFYVTANNSLPEGAITSPLFANYIMAEIIDDISDEVAAMGGEIYAYMDDISIMFKTMPAKGAMFKINAILNKALHKRGLRLNKTKTNMITGQRKREIFGTCFLKYNGAKNHVTIRLTRPDRKKLRARLHNMKKFLKAYYAYLSDNRALVPDAAYIAASYPKGFDEQSHLRIPRMLNKLGGSIAWAMSISSMAYQAMRDSYKSDCVLFFKSKIAPLVRECSAGLVDLDIKGKVKLDQIDAYLTNGGV